MKSLMVIPSYISYIQEKLSFDAALGVLPSEQKLHSKSESSNFKSNYNKKAEDPIEEGIITSYIC